MKLIKIYSKTCGPCKVLEKNLVESGVEYDSVDVTSEEGEDDVDIAKVILSIATGAPKTYISLTLGLLATIAGGVILIKKFV